jgi:hypothetical protein
MTYLVPQPLARNDSDLIADALVGLEVEGEFGVVALDDDLGGLLDRLRSYATHDCGVVEVESLEVHRLEIVCGGDICAKSSPLCARINFRAEIVSASGASELTSKSSSSFPL